MLKPIGKEQIMPVSTFKNIVIVYKESVGICISYLNKHQMLLSINLKLNINKYVTQTNLSRVFNNFQD